MQHVQQQGEAQITALLSTWTDPRTVVFFLVVMVDLVIAIIHFTQAGDVSMFTPLLAYAAGYTGLRDLSSVIESLHSNLKSWKSKEVQ